MTETHPSAALDHHLLLPSGLELPNRIGKAAMSERLATSDGAPSHELLRVYQRWAAGGAGLLITGNVMIDARHIGERGNVIVEGQEHLPALQRWARTAQAGAGRVLVQINHPGRQTPRWTTPEPVAPSAVPLQGAGGLFARPRALREEEIFEIVERFAHSATILEAAGFDGVQIHGAHGYLVSQFLSPRTNLRDDAWGGTPDKRRRFAIEVVRAVRRSVSSTFAVAIKLNSADFQRGGFDQHESLDTIDAIAAEGVDLVEISGGTYESAAMFEETVPQRESSKRREAFFIDFAEQVRQRVALPLMVTGGFRTASGMNEALASGAVDVVGLARPLAAEPDLPTRLLTGTSEGATPVRLATGSAKLDSVLQGSWYGAQIARMSRGLAPDPRLSRLRALWHYLWPHGSGTPLDAVSPSAAISRPSRHAA